MTPQDFIRKWKRVALTERASAQTHFNDLCALVGHDDPIKADPRGESFTFEKGVTKTGGGGGFADVWKKSFFAWEYKKKKRNLDEALAQLVRYAAALENPPLQVACDTDRFLIRTAWTREVPKTYEFALDDLADPKNLGILHSVFFDPDQLRPKETRAGVTKKAADKFSTIALLLQGRGTPEEIAHFVNQLVFCFFAHSVKLLPDGFFPRLLKRCSESPQDAKRYFDGLFAAMEKGGDFDLTRIAHFNGGLFDGRAALPLDSGDIGLLIAAGSLDWSQIDPTIFGTLFERFLDPEKRGQIGAHYTDPDKIMMIVEPVILRPLREEWAAVRTKIVPIAEKAEGIKPKTQSPGDRRDANLAARQLRAQAIKLRDEFLQRLRAISVLDPACGSGNFLYLALQGVKDIENRAVLECEAMGLPPRDLAIGPEILHGIEINTLAAELARTTIWIGDIQWAIRNGIFARPEPILRKLDSIECRDALLTPDGKDGFVEAEWPQADFIVGNPPFLGGKLLRRGLGDKTVETLFRVYDGRVPAEADLVCYWFAKAWAAVEAGRAKRVGLVATNSIRGGANRKVLEPIAGRDAIFEAWSDQPWTIDGAAVRVSLVCFGEGANANQSPHPEEPRSGVSKDEGGATPFETAASPPPQGEGAWWMRSDDAKRLDGEPVGIIHADLTADANQLPTAQRLRENANAAFMGDTKGGAFDIEGRVARAWLSEPLNANGRPNSDVLSPWINGLDLTRRPREMWIVDFGWTMSEGEAALYEAPFGYAIEKVKPDRAARQPRGYAKAWWRHERPRPDLWAALRSLQDRHHGRARPGHPRGGEVHDGVDARHKAGHDDGGDSARYIATPRVAKHRLFAWRPTAVCPDSATIAIARDDDTTFGILHSRFHEAWSLRLGTSLEDRPRYTPTTTFETFPFPEGLTPDIAAADYADNPRAMAIAAAAKKLDGLRRAWLNPADLVDVVPEVTPTAAPGEAPRRYPDRIVPKTVEAAAKLRERALTNLYNQRPRWLADAHDALDRAVAAAYRWPEDIPTEDALARLLALNLERAAAVKPDQPH